jgi:hypothetical protein
MKGELVTETLDYDGGRGVSVYVPAAAVDAVIFAGDGMPAQRNRSSSTTRRGGLSPSATLVPMSCCARGSATTIPNCGEPSCRAW